MAHGARQHGIGLVEILVSLAVGMFLMAGVIQIFLSSKQSYRTNEAIARVQESGRFAIDFITRDARSADYWGCLGNVSKIINHVIYETGGNAVPPPWNDGGITGTNGTGPNDSDTLTLQGAYGNALTITSHNVASASFTMNTVNHGLVDGDLVLATNCEMADYFMITNANSGHTVTVVANTGNMPGDKENGSKPGLQYNEGDLYKLTRYDYSIGTGASGRPALFKSVNGGTAVEIVDGIENMQIEYGVDTTGDRAVDSYVTANNVANWDNVLAVRVSLLVAGPEPNVLPETQSIAYNGGTVANTDRRLRQVFTTTIGLRNRLP